MAELGRGQRPADQVALQRVATQFGRRVTLLAGLHAFPDHDQMLLVGDRDDRLDERIRHAGLQGLDEPAAG